VSALSDATHFDTLIVGAGSAGAILATRLSEDPERSVCLIEAGPDYASVDELPDRIRTRGEGARIYGGVWTRSHEWAYTARATAAQPEMRLPRGRVIGGSSSINGVVLLHALRSTSTTGPPRAILTGRSTPARRSIDGSRTTTTLGTKPATAVTGPFPCVAHREPSGSRSARRSTRRAPSSATAIVQT
jgi:choline dehydrogenase